MRKILAVMAVIIVSVAQVPAFAGEAEKKEEKKNWFDLIKFSGDFRWREEYRQIDKYDSGFGDYSMENRQRMRLRFRFGFDADVNKDWKVSTRFASGDSDMRTTNQTYKDSFSTKGLQLDAAFFKYTPVHPKMEKKEKIGGSEFEILGGKMKNPFFKPDKSQLISDADLNPEGVCVRFHAFLGKKGSFTPFALVGLFPMDEIKGNHDEAARLEVIQLGGKFKLGKDTSLTVGFGYYGLPNVRGHAVIDPEDKGSGHGNTLDASDEYVNSYHLSNIFIDFGFKAGNVPMSVWFDYVTNNGADEDHTGMIVGVSAKLAAKKLGISLYYRMCEKDAVFAAFTDSDFAGGNMDASGLCLGLGYKLDKNVELAATYFNSDVGLDSDDPDHYDRLQLDVKLKF